MKRIRTSPAAIAEPLDQQRINGVLTVTARLARSSGAPLPSWSGCRRLGPGDVFLVGQADGSFDGRYFGVTDAREIVAPLAPQAAIGGPQARN